MWSMTRMQWLVIFPRAIAETRKKEQVTKILPEEAMQMK